MEDKKQKILSSVWSSLKNFLATQGGNLIEEILKQIFKSSLGGGVKGWIVKKMITVFREEIGEPAVEAILVEAQYSFDKINGKIIVKRLTDARDSNDLEDYNSSVDDINSESCKTGIAERRIICNQIEEHQIPYVEKCDISFQFNRCRCRCFDMNQWKTMKLNQCARYSDVPASVTELDFPLQHCEGIDGYRLEDEARDIRPNVRALDNLRSNLCQ